MACYYCSKSSVNSSDVGRCEEQCGKLVCTHGVSSRPHDYHADHCDCGCASLVCVYEMRDHAKLTHRSTVEQCFPSSSTHIALGAGGAIEDSADIDVSSSSDHAVEIRRAVFRFVEFNGVPTADMPLPIRSQRRMDEDLEFRVRPDDWPRVAAALVPHMMTNLVRSWRRVPRQTRENVDSDIAERIERLVKSRYADPRHFKSKREEVVAAWYDFSPRLAFLFAEYGPFDLLSSLRQLHAHDFGMPEQASYQHWRDVPQRLTLSDHGRQSAYYSGGR